MNEKKDPQTFDVTSDLFIKWRSPRFGDENPTKIESKVWEWLVHSKLSGYEATEKMNGPSPLEEGPTWNFARMGQSTTALPDGRTIYIGGEHEDHYDPDFNIYNDVIVINPDDTVEFYCYSKDDFPPTDFHSATLVGNNIVIIGSLGYPEDRIRAYTQLYLLDISSFKIEKINSSGCSPGWIHKHQAILSSDNKSIAINNGEVDVGSEHSLRENIDDWSLNIFEWRWDRLSEKKWTRWEIKSRNKTYNHLWDIRRALFSLEANWENDYKNKMDELSRELGYLPDVKLVKKIYTPDIPHKILPIVDDEYNIFRISINDVTVRFVEEMYYIQVTVEGKLPDSVIEHIKQYTLNKISILENSTYEIASF
jgi:hypothetical protein